MVCHKRKRPASQRQCQQGNFLVTTFGFLTADLVKTAPFMEAHRSRVRWPEVDLAGEDRNLVANASLKIFIQYGCEADPAGTRRDSNPVDVGEHRVVCEKPTVIRAGVVTAFTQSDEECSNRALVDCNPKIARVIHEPGHVRVGEAIHRRNNTFVQFENCINVPGTDIT